MGRIAELLEIIRYKHLLVLLSYVVAAAVLSPKPLETGAVLVATAGILGLFASAYSYNYVTDEKEDAKNRKPTPLAFISKNKVVLFAATSTAAALAASAAAGAIPLAISAVMVVTGFFYSHPGVRLKKFFGIKTFAIIGWWFLAFVYFSIAIGGSPSPQLLVIAAFFSLTSLTGTVLRDVVDAPGDAAHGIRTIPVVLGEYLTTVFLTGVVIAKYALLLTSIFSTTLPVTYLTLLGTIPVKRRFLRGLANKQYRACSNYSLGSYLVTTAAVIAAKVI